MVLVIGVTLLQQTDFLTLKEFVITKFEGGSIGNSKDNALTRFVWVRLGLKIYHVPS